MRCMPTAAQGICRGRTRRSDRLCRGNKILIGLRISQPADFGHVAGVRPLIWLPRRRRSVRFLLASVSTVFAGSLAVHMAVAGNGGPIPVGSQSLVLPDFAKNVQVRVDGKL